jgi:hypothetical protein
MADQSGTTHPKTYQIDERPCRTMGPPSTIGSGVNTTSPEVGRHGKVRRRLDARRPTVGGRASVPATLFACSEKLCYIPEIRLRVIQQAVSVQRKHEGESHPRGILPCGRKFSKH